MYPQITHVPLLFHFHQPVGQFGFVYEEAYKKSYLPLITFLFHFPKVKANLHFSGPLLEWLDLHRPDFFSEFIIPMLERKQIELVSGGYYEPVLVSIPDEDKIAQIQKLNNYWSNKLGKIKPEGLWLTERVWEPGLVKPLADAGIKWVLIDDENFELNTYRQARSSYYPVITEDQGQIIRVVAINEQIRYLIPWKPVQDTYNFLKSVRDSTDPHLIFKPLIVIMSDAEKMGLWPAGERSTYDICYGTGFTGKPWIQELFQMIDETPWIVSCTISEYFEQYKQHPLPISYFKTDSYDKMGVWALPTPERRGIEKLKKEIRYKTAPIEIQKLNLFLKGSHWRSFIAKYFESNQLHKKMLFTRQIYSSLLKNYGQYLNNHKNLEKGYDLILEVQCNDVYWHGQFGGIYYRFMREYSYSCLIKAITLFEESFKKDLGKNLLQNVTVAPILLTGTQDVVINSPKVQLYIALGDGGTVFSIDDKESYFNFSNVFSRIIEAYHPEKGDLEKGIVNDDSPRRSFRDYFLIKKPVIKEFYENTKKINSLFHNSPYEIVTIEENNASIILNCTSTFEGNVLSIEKTYKLNDSQKKVYIKYKITNLSDGKVTGYFIPEINFILPGNDKKLFLQINKQKQELYDQLKLYDLVDVSSIKVFNNELSKGIEINFQSILLPIQMYTILSHEYSESLSYHNYQGHCLLPCKGIQLDAYENEEISIDIELI
jgi:alpha-amylase